LCPSVMKLVCECHDSLLFVSFGDEVEGEWHDSLLFAPFGDAVEGEWHD